MRNLQTFTGIGLTILVLLTSCYYTYRTSILHNMYNAYKQAEINSKMADCAVIKKSKEDKKLYRKIAKIWYKLAKSYGKDYKLIFTPFLFPSLRSYPAR
jgi:hypothetical protein